MTLLTWRAELASEMASNEDPGPVIHVAPSEAVLDVEFDASYGNPHGAALLVWTEGWVYFPVFYDGSEWLGSAPRNPTPHGQPHVGGG